MNEELKVKDYTEFTNTSLESATGLLGSIYDFEGFAEDVTISDNDRYSEAELMDMIGKLPPEAFKSGVAQQIIQTARSGKRIEIDGKNQRINFYGDNEESGIKFYDINEDINVASFNVGYSSGAGGTVTGFDIASGGGSDIYASGKSNTGFMGMIFNDTVDIRGVLLDWYGGDMPGTVNTAIVSRLSFYKTEITGLGAGFTIAASSLETPFITLAATAARTSDTTTAIGDGTNDGQFLVLMGTDDTNTITIKDGANTALAGDCALGDGDTLTLIWNGSDWCEISRSNN